MRSMDDVAARFSSPVPDVLGEPWQARTLTLAGDGEAPPPVATLVQRATSAQAPVESGTRRAVLYIHGFVDYFFQTDRKSTRLNSSHVAISYAVFCLKKKKE